MLKSSQIAIGYRVLISAAILLALVGSLPANAILLKASEQSKLLLKDFPTPQQVLEREDVGANALESILIRQHLLFGLAKLARFNVNEEQQSALPTGMSSVREWADAANGLSKKSRKSYSEESIYAANLALKFRAAAMDERDSIISDEEYALLTYFPEIYQEYDSRQSFQKTQIVAAMGVMVIAGIVALLSIGLVTRYGFQRGIHKSPVFLSVLCAFIALAAAYYFWGPILTTPTGGSEGFKGDSAIVFLCGVVLTIVFGFVNRKLFGKTIPFREDDGSSGSLFQVGSNHYALSGGTPSESEAALGTGILLALIYCFVVIFAEAFHETGADRLFFILSVPALGAAIWIGWRIIKYLVVAGAAAALLYTIYNYVLIG